VSVRDDPVLFLQQGKGRTTGGGSAGGGSAITTTHVHRLDGPEHSTASDSALLDATTTAHGLMPKLSGDADDMLHGDGTWAPGDSIDVRDEGASLTTAPSSIDFVGEGVTATAVGGAVTVTIPSGGLVPYYIPVDDTFTVPLYRQALFSEPIEVDGALVVNGLLIGVD
jgi:hypothetical protein